jgi:hypothetical protein
MTRASFLLALAVVAAGCRGPVELAQERPIAAVAHARRALQAAGISAVPTRTDDYRIAIVARAAIVGAVKPKAVVSIHHNASFSELRATPGTEVFHQAVGASAAESRRLAGLLYPGRGFIDPPQLADDNRPGGGTENCQDPPLG